jgi:hypothetical protein
MDLLMERRQSWTRFGSILINSTLFNNEIMKFAAKKHTRTEMNQRVQIREIDRVFEKLEKSNIQEVLRELYLFRALANHSRVLILHV